MMDETIEQLTFPYLFAETVKKHAARPAMSMIGEKHISYHELDLKIKALIAWFEKLGVSQGDKVAILSASIPNWGASYYAITFMGAAVVPILPDFHSSEIRNILKHSAAGVLLVSDGLMPKIQDLDADVAPVRIRIEDFTLIGKNDKIDAFDPFSIPARQYKVTEEDLAAIIYTSGTTGKSKGVMLTHRNICFTAKMSERVQEINENDRFLSVLPLSHTYENTIGLIFPMTKGACIYYLGKAPSPSVLLPALKEIKPTVMLTVPLIIEKIFRSKIKPKFSKNIVLRFAVHIPFIRRKLNQLAGRKLLETFGGELRFFGIGGAKLNKTVETFLIEARFPYAIGYGLTETSPLLAGSNPRNSRLQSTGPAISGIELIINNPDKLTGEGEIWAKGPNVMKGYYKEPELTKEVITPDGWFRTGDLGILDQDGFLYIRGRLKNMIVRSGGENIFPEEIESVINNFKHVVDSLVLERNSKLVALVNFNTEEITEMYHMSKEDTANTAIVTNKLLIELQAYVNHRVNKYSQIQEVILQPEPFEKTATLKIRRYLYT
jgi:long-chain acyl-CoA synthetase